MACDEDRLGKVVKALCQSGKFETGEGTCAPICMSILGDARARPCPHAKEVFEDLARSVLKALDTE